MRARIEKIFWLALLLLPEANTQADPNQILRGEEFVGAIRYISCEAKQMNPQLALDIACKRSECAPPASEQKSPLAYRACVNQICQSFDRPSIREQMERIQIESARKIPEIERMLFRDLSAAFSDAEKFTQQILLNPSARQAKPLPDTQEKNFLIFSMLSAKLHFRLRGGSVSLDPVATERALASEAAPVREWAKSILDRASQLNMLGELRFLGGFGLGNTDAGDMQNHLLDIVPGAQTPIHAVGLAIPHLRENIKQLRLLGQVESVKIMERYLQRVDRVAANPNPTSTELGELASFYSWSNLLLKISGDKELAHLFSTPISGVKYELGAEFLANSRSSHNRRTLEELRNSFAMQGDGLAKLRRKQLDRCIASIAYYAEALPSEKQLLDFQRLIGDFRSRAQGFAGQYFDGETRQILAEYFKKANINLPESREAFLKNLPHRIRESRQRSQELNSITDPNLYLGFLNSPRDIYGVFSDICENNTPRNYTDRVYTKHGAIVISPLAVANAVAGRGVLNHELGHVLSKALRDKRISAAVKKWLAEVESCLARKHKPPGFSQRLGAFLSGAPTDFDPEDYVEEDGADQFYALLEPKDLPNAGCIQMDRRPFSFSALALEDYESGDSHSTNFFRLLHAEVLMRGRLPELCEAALRNRGDMRDFSSCLPPSAIGLPIPAVSP